jgi:nucleotide-binding universal stress UspA family protein
MGNRYLQKNLVEVIVYKTILVPLDRSKRAEAILPHVAYLALKCNAKVIFLKVLEHPFTAAPTKKSIEKLQKDFDARQERSKEYLSNLKRKFGEKGIDCAARLAHGPVVEEIIAAAQRESADLIAIASHGRSGMSRVFYGSVTAALLNRVDRPLLLVRSL